MIRTRKGSPKTFKMEPTGPKVPSRYLTGPTGSCHDNCKPTTEPKAINPLPKRIPKPSPRINKPPSPVPKTTTRNLKNNNVVKDQTLKKDAEIEPKKRDFKQKSVNTQAKTYNGPSSRTPRRRLSDICVPNKDMSIPTSRFPKRRLSESIIHQNTNVASVSNGSTVQGSRANKNESRKDSKLPMVNKKFSSSKTTVSTSKTNARVSPLRTYKSIPKPEPKGSRKSKPVKPIEEVVREETLHVTEPNNDTEITKSQSQKRPDCPPSSSDVKATQDDQNEVMESSLPSLEDDRNELVESSPPSLMEDQVVESSLIPPPVKEDQNVVVESSPPSPKDEQNEMVKSSPPSLVDDQNVVEGSLPPSSIVDQNVVVESLLIPPSLKEDQNVVMESLLIPRSHEDDQNEVVESSPPTMQDDTLAKDDQQNDNVVDSEINDTKETDDLRFTRGTILSPESETNSLIELQFKKGKELENETKEGEKTSLRRLSSEGVVCIPESVPISVDLKHQEMEEKKAAVLSNNVIEETASKLIQTRRSKVKALVGAFETIVSGETPKSYTRNT